MPTLTVSMPAYNSGKYIRESIESVLRQEGVDFELVVVDDASSDDTVRIVQSVQDPRVHLIRNQRTMGIGYCHNLVVRRSNSTYVAHVDSDDLVLPCAFQKMIQKLESDPELGQVHCHFLLIDEQGRPASGSSDTTPESLLRKRKQHRNYRRDLIVHGCIINALRTYRREVFNRIGYFDENERRGVDYRMAVRLVDKYKIGVVPEFLYCYRLHKDSVSRRWPVTGLKAWAMRAHFCHQLLKRKQITFLNRKEYFRLITLGFYHHVLRLDRILFYPRKVVRSIRRPLSYSER